MLNTQGSLQLLLRHLALVISVTLYSLICGILLIPCFTQAQNKLPPLIKTNDMSSKYYTAGGERIVQAEYPVSSDSTFVKNEAVIR